MEPDERGKGGSYSPPAGLVRGVVRAGREAVLVHRFGLAPRAAERWVHHDEAPQSPAERPDLRRLTVLDPAVGSGAFLLGALEELTRLRRAGGEGPPRPRRRGVLGRPPYRGAPKPPAGGPR